MALSPAEKQKRYRDRQKEATKGATDLTRSFLRTPFFKAIANDGNWSSVELAFDMMGIPAPDFTDDSGPKSLTGAVEDQDANVFGDAKHSLGRAELMVDHLLDAATELASMINRYKLDEIGARIAEIEQADLSDATARAKALEDIVALRGLKARLDGKTFRRSFAEFSVKGTASS